MKKLQTLFLSLALAVSGGAFARTVTVVHHNPDGSFSRVVRHVSNGDHVRIRRDVYVNPGHHYGWYNNHRRVVVLHPAHRHHHHYVSRRTVIVRHYG